MLDMYGIIWNIIPGAHLLKNGAVRCFVAIDRHCQRRKAQCLHLTRVEGSFDVLFYMGITEARTLDSVMLTVILVLLLDQTQLYKIWGNDIWNRTDGSSIENKESRAQKNGLFDSRMFDMSISVWRTK
jgi:hypothetical protein